MVEEGSIMKIPRAEGFEQVLHRIIIVINQSSFDFAIEMPEGNEGVLRIPSYVNYRALGFNGGRQGRVGHVGMKQAKGREAR